MTMEMDLRGGLILVILTEPDLPQLAYRVSSNWSSRWGGKILRNNKVDP